MKTNMLRPVFALAVGACLSPVFGGNVCWWFGGEGSVSDTAKYHRNLAPVEAADSVYFSCTNDSGAAYWKRQQSRVTFPQSFYLNMLNLGAKTADMAAGWDACAVELCGPADAPGTLYLDQASQINISEGRSLTVRDLNLVRENRGTAATTAVTVRDGASLTFGPGSSMTTPKADNEYVFLLKGSRLVIDGGSLKLGSLNLQADDSQSGVLDIRAGRLELNAAYAQTFDRRADVRFTGGEIVLPIPLSSYRFIPQGRNANLTILTNTVMAFNLRNGAVPDGMFIPWRGTVDITNGQSGAMIPDFNGTVYGGGKLRCPGIYCYVRPVTQDVWLSELAFSRGFNIQVASAGSDFSFHDTTFRPYGGIFSWTLSSGSYVARLFGRTTFATVDGLTGETRNMDPRYLVVASRASLAVTGPGTVSARFVDTDSMPGMPARLQSFSLDDGATFSNNQSKPYRGRIRMQTLAMGAGSTFDIGLWSSGEEIMEVVGEVEVDATARVTSYNKPSSMDSTTVPVARFISLDDDATLPEVVAPANLLGTHSVQRVGGCIFTAPTNGIEVSGGTGSWCGNGTTGNWSDGANWCNGTRQQWYYSVSFYGTRNLYSTNDITEESYRGYNSLEFQSSAGPFHLSGVAIPLGRSYNETVDGGAIATSSEFPVFLELPLSSAKEKFAAVVKSANGMVVFRDTVSVPNGQFIPCGSVVVDGGTVTAKELVLGHAWARPTILTVQRGGSVTASAQESAISEASSLWIATGGVVTVNGPWRWTATENEHQVDGLLDIRGNICGTSRQSYFGKGEIKVYSSTSDADDAAAIRLGEGVTLSPKAWGAVPVDVVSDATLGGQADWTYAVASGLSVSGLDATLTFDGAYTTTVNAPFSGRDYSLAKDGTGTLVLAAGVGNTLSARKVTLSGGTLQLTADVTLGKLEALPGTTLAFSSKPDGSVAGLTVNASVDLDGMVLTPADAEAVAAVKDGYVTVLTVPAGCDIDGTPSIGSDLRLRKTVNADGSVSLALKERRGFIFMYR